MQHSDRSRNPNYSTWGDTKADALAAYLTRNHPTLIYIGPEMIRDALRNLDLKLSERE